MRAELRTYFSPDVDLENLPGGNSPANSILLTLVVGPIGAPGEESFDVSVCTPKWIEARIAQTGSPLVGRHLLVVNSINIFEIVAFLKQQIGSLDAPTWQELAQTIGRIGRWEFEDYLG